MKRLTIIALIVLLIAGVFVSCNEENIVDDEFIPPIDITSETTTLIPGSRYRTVEDTTIADRITIDGEGSVTIILKEGTTLTAEKGINVTEDQEIIIQGTGKLEATGDPKSAGIGGGDGEDGGTVRIQGGDITANGGNAGGAGIGGGKGGKSGTTIIEKKEGKAAPDVKTKGGTSESHGIGNGDGVTEDPEEVKLNGMDLEVSDNGVYWDDYDGDNPDQYMRSYVPVIVTFNANGGTGSMPAQKVHAGVATTLNANAYTRTGMSFKGWNTAKDGSGKAYANMASVTLTEDVTLYAQWEVAPTGNYITAETTTIQSGLAWTIQDNVVNPNRISIEGTDETTIILPKDLKLTVELGIGVSAGQTLIIDGDDTGELDVGSKLEPTELTHQNKSGIGGNSDNDLGGTIIINGGKITAVGGFYAPGIGGTSNTFSESGTAVVIINGGTVNATGGTCAAGIEVFKSSITINNGTIIANGGNEGSGIGGTDSIIKISGGDIKATGSRFSAGIGGTDLDSCKEIIIEGGNVVATGGSYSYATDEVAGAGIGGGDTMSGGKITITGGKIEATGGTYGGAGIGGGRAGDSGEITISGGTITATAGSADADGIGKGSGSGERDIAVSGVTLFVSEDDTDWSLYTGTPRQYMKTDNVQLNYITSYTTALEAGKTYTISGNVENNNRITISGAVTISLPAGRTLTLSKGITVAEGQTLTITGDSSGKLYATGIERAAGIGGVDTVNGGSIIINGGQIYATGGAGGAGIGGGRKSSCDVTINGGKVEATGGSKYTDYGSNDYCGGAGIGSGQGSSTITVNITGGVVTANGTDAGTGIGGAANWSGTNTTIRITISGGEITASAGANASINSINYAAAGIGGSFGQPINVSGTGSMTITLSGSPKIKASAGVNTGAEAYRYAWGIGRGNFNSLSVVEANLDVSGLDVAAKLRVSATDTDNYVDFDGSNRMRYMKTDNYDEPEP